MKRGMGSPKYDQARAREVRVAGSLLGEEKLRILGEMATAADAQIWLEYMCEADDGKVSVFIEDGSVKPRQPKLAMSQAAGV